VAFRGLRHALFNLVFRIFGRDPNSRLNAEEWSIAEAESRLHDLARSLGFTHLPEESWRGSMNDSVFKFRKGTLEIWGGHDRGQSYVELCAAGHGGMRHKYSPDIIACYANARPLAATNMNPDCIDALERYLPPLINELEGPNRRKVIAILDGLCESLADRLFGSDVKQRGT